MICLFNKISFLPLNSNIFTLKLIKLTFNNMKCSFLFRAAIMVALPLVLVSCGGKKPATDKPADDTTKKDSAAVAAAREVENTANKQADFANKLPSPVHIARLFKKSGLKYVPGLANPVENTKKYVSSSSQSMNLGVYTTDLAYAAMNKQTDVAGSYFKAVGKVADGLNLSSVFSNKDFAKRFEVNLGNQDSLLHLMTELQAESDELLKETNRYDVVNLSFGGAWVESMYLSSKIYSSDPNPELGNRMTQQGPVISALVKLLLLHEKDPASKALAKSLTEIKEIIDGMGAIKGTSSPEWKEKFTKELQPKIELVRNSIVEKA